MRIRSRESVHSVVRSIVIAALAAGPAVLEGSGYEDPMSGAAPR